VITGISEVLSQQTHVVDPQVAERLSVIASVSRRSVEAMSDIVWAVNPDKDHLKDLAQRMLRFASESFTVRNIEFHFDAPDKEHNVRIAADVRREIFLIFKEGVNNIVRHSRCTSADVAVEIDHRMIIVKVSDNGCGFETTSLTDGQGLTSMRRRAEKLDARFTLTSRPGAGTSIVLEVNLGSHRRDGTV
jgi:signal transduction histidine kinase